MGIAHLVEGYRRFRTTRFAEARELYQRLGSRGQSPKTLIIACCDSRVDPATITDAGPGELFVVRNVANLVPRFAPDGHHHGTSAALEFAVRRLEVEDIVVMGHAQCGGARTLWDQKNDVAPDTDFIGAWVSIAYEARASVQERYAHASLEEQLIQLEHELVRLSLRNLMSFDWIRSRLERRALALHGWYFGIASGVLHVMDAETGEFRPFN
ncbi:MAG: carbonic anhydrase [Gammaproteobacteria bacterium]